MAIEGNELPKGVSNSAKMGATPGTQQTAINNVGGPKLNFEMPAGPQLAKQAKSSFQSSITPKMPIPTSGTSIKPISAHTAPRPSGPLNAPVITHGLPMDNGRGYNVFAGMDAMQIGQMNSDMGLSNMTSLPQFKPEANQFYTGGQMMGNAQLMHHGDPEPPIDYDPYDNYGEDDSVYLDALAKWNEDELAHKLAEDEFNEVMAANEAPAEKAIVEDEEGKPTAESLIYENYDDILANPAGFSPEKMAEMESKLDEKYARELLSALSGIDRQMAMMGTFGSGAHSFSINNATSQALGAMADEYAQLEKANALQYEKEYQETILNKNVLSDKLSNLEGLEGNKNKEAIVLKSTLETETGIAQYISNELKALAPQGQHLFTGFFNDLSGDLFDKLTNGEMTEDEVIGEYHARSEALMDALTAYAARSPAAQSKFDYFFAISGVDGSNFSVNY